MWRRFDRPAALVVAGLTIAACAEPNRTPDSTGEAEVTVSGPDLWVISEDLRVERIADGVWLHTSWHTLDSGGRIPSNGLLVEDEGELVLIDTAWGPELTVALLRWVDRTLGLPVREAVVTHFHDDRMSGVPQLLEWEVPYGSHPLTVDLTNPVFGPPPQPLEGVVDGPVRLGGVEVFFPGAGHTRDNLVVWVPERSVLFGGCAVRPLTMTGLGNTADADLESWPLAVRSVAERYGSARIVVPSHGPPGGQELLDHTMAQFP